MLKQFLPQIGISRIRNAWSLFKRAFSGYKWQIVILAVLGLLVGLLEGIGINALIPLFSQFSGESSIPEFDTISRLIVNSFDFFGISTTLPTLLALVVILFLAKGLILILFEYVSIHIRKEYERKTRDQIFGKTLKARWPYLMKQKPGYLSTVIRTDIAKGGDMLANISSIIMVGTSTLVYLIIAFNISQAVTSIVLVSGAFVFLIFKPLFYRARKVAERTTNMNKEIDRHVNESIYGVKTIKVFAKENPVSKLANSMFKELYQLSVSAAMYRKFATAFIEPASVLVVAGVVAFSYYQTAYNLGALAAIVYLIHRIFVYVKQVQDNIHTINETVPYLNQLLLFQKNAVDFTETKDDDGKSFSFKENIEFDQVRFQYDHDEVLKGISMNIKKGQVVGLIGASGGGKTTTFDMLLRLLEPTSGSIKIDGVDCKNINLNEWRSNVSYVPQDTFLISDTLENNIRFYDDTISDDDIREAAVKAHVDEFAKELPLGYKTILGPDGVRLSAGQQQRLAIARSLARKPKILLLDEATSALDRDFEMKIEKVFEDLRGEVTICMIAHRVQTIRHADILFVIDDGKVVESGKPSDLLGKDGSYFARILNLSGGKI